MSRCYLNNFCCWYSVFSQSSMSGNVWRDTLKVEIYTFLYNTSSSPQHNERWSWCKIRVLKPLRLMAMQSIAGHLCSVNFKFKARRMNLFHSFEPNKVFPETSSYCWLGFTWVFQPQMKKTLYRPLILHVAHSMSNTIPQYAGRRPSGFRDSIYRCRDSEMCVSRPNQADLVFR